MDIDDQVYFYVAEEEGSDSLTLLETYKVTPVTPAIVLNYGLWNGERGLEVSDLNIWQRRRDMRVRMCGEGS